MVSEEQRIVMMEKRRRWTEVLAGAAVKMTGLWRINEEEEGLEFIGEEAVKIPQSQCSAACITYQ